MDYSITTEILQRMDRMEILLQTTLQKQEENEANHELTQLELLKLSELQQQLISALNRVNSKYREKQQQQPTPAPLPTTKPEDCLLTVSQVATICNLTTSTLRKHIQHGRLKAYDLSIKGAQPVWRIQRSDLDEFIKAHPAITVSVDSLKTYTSKYYGRKRVKRKEANTTDVY